MSSNSTSSFVSSDEAIVGERRRGAKAKQSVKPKPKSDEEDSSPTDRDSDTADEGDCEVEKIVQGWDSLSGEVARFS
jgi:hypothetical protein